MKFEDFNILPNSLPLKIPTNRDILCFFVKRQSEINDEENSNIVSNKYVFKIMASEMSTFYGFLPFVEEVTSNRNIEE